MKSTNEIPVDEHVSQAVSVLNVETLKFLVEQANLKLSNLDATLRDAISRCWILVGWLATLASSLSIALASQLRGGNPDTVILILTIFGLISSVAIMLYVMLNNFVFVGWFGPGNEPSFLARKEVTDVLTGLDDEDENRYILASDIVAIQQTIEYNRGVLGKVVRHYRIAVFSMVGSIVSAAVLLLILVLI